MKMKKIAQLGSRYAPAIISRLNSERAINLTDSEINRCLATCVGGYILPDVARHLRDNGIIGFVAGSVDFTK